MRRTGGRRVAKSLKERTKVMEKKGGQKGEGGIE